MNILVTKPEMLSILDAYNASGRLILYTATAGNIVTTGVPTVELQLDIKTGEPATTVAEFTARYTFSNQVEAFEIIPTSPPGKNA